MNLHELAKETAKIIRSDPHGCPQTSVLIGLIECVLRDARKQGMTDAAVLCENYANENHSIAQNVAGYDCRNAILSARDQLDQPTKP